MVDIAGWPDGFLDLVEDVVDVAFQGMSLKKALPNILIQSFMPLSVSCNLVGLSKCEAYLIWKPRFSSRVAYSPNEGEIPDLCGGICIVVVNGEGFAGGHNDIFDIAFSAHFENQPAAGAEGVVDLVDGGFFFQYPVQGSVRENGVEG